MKQYRNNGAKGALLDEYERAIKDLKKVLKTVSESELVHIVDKDTPDEDCRSIQSILAHVVRSGYVYVMRVRMIQGEECIFPERIPLKSVKEYNKALDKMFEFNVQLFDEYPDLDLENTDYDSKVAFLSGQLYDFEQLFEHAIVHILRHRRQIERFLLKIKM